MLIGTPYSGHVKALAQVHLKALHSLKFGPAVVAWSACVACPAYLRSLHAVLCCNAQEKTTNGCCRRHCRRPVFCHLCPSPHAARNDGTGLPSVQEKQEFGEQYAASLLERQSDGDKTA